MIGWLPMEIPVSLDGVNNVRPIVKQAFEENKVAIIHWVDKYRKSVCGKATWMTSALDNNNMSTACEDIDDEALRPRWVKIGLICPDCYKIWEIDEENKGKKYYQNIAKQLQEGRDFNDKLEAENQA